MERLVLAANLLSDGLVGFMVIALMSQNDCGSDLLILKGHKCCSCVRDLCVCCSKVDVILLNKRM